MGMAIRTQSMFTVKIGPQNTSRGWAGAHVHGGQALGDEATGRYHMSGILEQPLQPITYWLVVNLWLISG